MSAVCEVRSFRTGEGVKRNAGTLASIADALSVVSAMCCFSTRRSCRGNESRSAVFEAYRLLEKA